VNREERQRLAYDYVQLNRRFEKRWYPRVLKAINSKISSLIDKLKSDGIDAAIRYLSIDLPNFQLRAVVTEMYQEVGVRHARLSERRLRKEVGKSGHYDAETKRFAGNAETWAQFIDKFLELYLLQKITFRVNETTKAELMKVLQEAIEKGWGVDEIVKRLEDLPFARYQAARIVRTEINRAANTGVHVQGETFEYELRKEWISVRDNRTRGVHPEDHADHYDMDEQQVDFTEKFRDPRNGHLLRFPGDPEASAEDVINCRCNMTTVAKRDENGRLIPKQFQMAA
jgi:hypothetical protein